MIIIGIETSCDETAVAVVKDGKEILSNLVASQIDLHQSFGGVVPEVASRRHLEVINPLIAETLKENNISLQDISAVAVTQGPGLEGALLVGIAVAKTISFSLNIPIIPVNHIESHIYANFLEQGFSLPSICLVVSGGHTDLFIMDESYNFKLLGRTRDDAAGEALDKGAKLLGLPYPGGPVIDKLAKEGNSEFVNFPRAYLGKDSFDFSFSGLKTSLLNYLKKNPQSARPELCSGTPNPQSLSDICASYQQAVVDVLVKKTVLAAQKFGISNILIGGGVGANSKLREEFKRKEKEFNLHIKYPSPELCTDNAAMVAVCGYYKMKNGGNFGLDFDALPYFEVMS